MNPRWLLLGLSMVSAPSSSVPVPAAALSAVLLSGVPHVEQKPDFCGEACAEMVLRHLGTELTQDDVFAAAGLDPALGRGLYTPELGRALAALGFEVGRIWYPLAPSAEGADLEAQFSAMHADLVAGVPSIVCMRYADEPGTTEHFRLVLGYAPESDEVIFHEPAEAAGSYQRMPRALFQKLWPLSLRKSGRTVIRLRLESRRAPEKPAQGSPTPAALAQHVLALRERLPGPGFTVAVQPPFVLVGDEPPATVRARAENNVRWTIERLKKDFFARDPEEIIDVWLFRDRASYLGNTWTLFHVRPDTPYGYYSDTENALVMNIGPGWGTLSHELVHPYVHTNFPECPPWLNEGLASLYERPGDEGGHIMGYPNWRLPGLKRALRQDRAPSFRALMAMDEGEFYGDGSDVNYAQARYLCYYLQEEGLLVEYVRQVRANAETDPTGYLTLQRVLGRSDMAAFEREWRELVLGLSWR